jgi:hypothetical protein
MKCVYQCIKDEPKLGYFGLTVRKRYKKGDYITYGGYPTQNLENAYIFNTDDYEIEDLDDYLRLVPVKVTVEII